MGCIRHVANARQKGKNISIMKEIFNYFPLFSFIFLVIATVLSITSFILADRFFRLIKYKPRMIYYIEIPLNLKEIDKKIENNPSAKRNLKLLFYFTLVSFSLFLFVFLTLKRQ